MTAAEALRTAIPRLREAGVEDAARDARLLLADAMGVQSDRLSLHLSDTLTDAQQDQFARHLDARAARQPVAQILGRRLFWGRTFRVTPDVLDPRPETETLVAAALAAPFAHVLDLGTGSGAILLSLLADRPDADGVGVDLSPAALDVARDNARALGVGTARFVHSDWFAHVEGRFDLVVSNPPYIAADEMEALSPEVRLHEPAMALTPGGDGLGAYSAIAAGVAAHLAPRGRVLLEIGPSQGAAVMALLRAAGLRDVACLPDMDGRDRVVIGTAPPG